MKKFKFPMAFVAILIAITAAFAFKAPSKNSSTDLIRYHYTSNSSALVDMQDIDNWEAEDPECAETGSKPCAIDFNGNLAQLNTYLDTFTASSQVTEAAVQRKN